MVLYKSCYFLGTNLTNLGNDALYLQMDVIPHTARAHVKTFIELNLFGNFFCGYMKVGIFVINADISWYRCLKLEKEYLIRDNKANVKTRRENNKKTRVLRLFLGTSKQRHYIP